MNSKLSNRDNNILKSIEANGSTVEHPALIAEEMKDYFYSSFQKRSVVVTYRSNIEDMASENKATDIKIDFHTVRSVIQYLPFRKMRMFFLMLY